MALGRTFGVGLSGIDGRIIAIEADAGRGLPGVHIVGKVDTTIRESRDRVRSALTNSALPWPKTRVVISLSPADLPKTGSGFDLAIAIAIMTALKIIPEHCCSRTVFLGELGLDGKLHRTRGTLPRALCAHKEGFDQIVVATEAGAEAALVSGIDVRVAHTLVEVVDSLRQGNELKKPQSCSPCPQTHSCNFADVVGHDLPKRALELAAAGGHNLLMIGPPGVGKTLLARCLPSILPPLSRAESLLVTTVHSVIGKVNADQPLMTSPPLEAPHHSVTSAALIGGGSPPHAGAISRSHCGVLFLDDCTEIPARILDSLRTPMDEGCIRISRSGETTVFPCRFQLILAANPCPCGASDPLSCRCGSTVRRRHLARISGPLIDRIDLRVDVRPVGLATLSGGNQEDSEHIARRVAKARARAHSRWSSAGSKDSLPITNGQVPSSVLREDFQLPPSVTRPLHGALSRAELSVRGFERCVRIAWTIADLEGHDSPTSDDMEQAWQFRGEQPR